MLLEVLLLLLPASLRCSCLRALCMARLARSSPPAHRAAHWLLPQHSHAFTWQCSSIIYWRRSAAARTTAALTAAPCLRL